MPERCFSFITVRRKIEESPYFGLSSPRSVTKLRLSNDVKSTIQKVLVNTITIHKINQRIAFINVFPSVLFDTVAGR